MKLITSFLVTFVLIGCSKINEDTFSLVCSGTEEIASNILKESKSQTRTLNFKGKKLDGYDCHTWTNEKILCSMYVDLGVDHTSKTETINIDRISGMISSNYTLNIKSPYRISEFNTTETFNGKCEKVIGKKF
ncbi:hypothetical protein PSHI8_21380 [Polynucleobacter sp. SHI8]|uniref:hypothetical protein n=1 Tax=unclassified Polynucleobacter TaxID=2640945 RepID=UPI002490AD0F|nr:MULTISPECIES: hypothetical protein [unclassified Polynucleobacter]BDW12054.1 hypothetical protein PSHI2_21360 [Polynucleobacter sp. SHI2]BDW14502.1 hypothetical protein PSHI8_21380 [Polynucleobacter sp. SHI8]